MPIKPSSRLMMPPEVLNKMEHDPKNLKNIKK